MKKKFMILVSLLTLSFCVTGCGEKSSAKNYTEFSFNNETGETVLVEEVKTETVKVENVEVESASAEAESRINNGEDPEKVREDVIDKYNFKIH